MSGLEHRLKKLEDETGQGEPCSECGHVPGQPFATDTMDFDVQWIYDPAVSEDERARFLEPEFCGTCGRQLVFVVRWDKPKLPRELRGEGRKA